METKLELTPEEVALIEQTRKIKQAEEKVKREKEELEKQKRLAWAKERFEEQVKKFEGSIKQVDDFIDLFNKTEKPEGLKLIIKENPFEIVEEPFRKEVVRKSVQIKVGKYDPFNIDFESDGKIMLPGMVYGTYRALIHKTAIQKINEWAKKQERLALETQKILNARKDIASKYQDKYPDAEFKFTEDRVYGRTSSSKAYFLSIFFANKNFIKLKVYSDGSMAVVKKEINATKGFKSADWIDYLAK